MKIRFRHPLITWATAISHVRIGGLHFELRQNESWRPFP
jgi:hypothetical protein